MTPRLGLARLHVAALWTAILSTAVACSEDVNPAAPPPDEGEIPVVLEQGLNVVLVVSDGRQPVGSEVRIDAKIRIVGEEFTPTAFVANFKYDPERLRLIESVSLGDGMLRVANFGADPGVARIAGAAAAGLSTETLFAVRLEVMAADYLSGITVEFDELAVIGKNTITNMASEISVNPTVATRETFTAAQSASGGRIIR